MRKIYFVILTMSFASRMLGQYSLSGNNYSQNFDDLGVSTSANVTAGSLNNINVTLNGWFFSESGTASNMTITAGTGSSATGDSYNFGVAAGSNRTLGGLQSGSLVPTFGFYFINNTGSTIKSLAISYTGETYRVATAGRSDKIDFQYSTDATLLTNGTWTDADALDYTNPGQATGNGSIQHSATISNSITGLNIATGGSFFIKWTDFNASGSDDGMGINDFSFTASSLGTLPVNFGTTKATRQSNNVKIEWMNMTELEVFNYSIERSVDGRNFTAVGSVNARFNNGGQADYSFIDANPFSGVNYYRIRSLETTGKSKYSIVVRVDILLGATRLVLYPNPVIAGQLTYHTNNLVKGQYTIRIINSVGQQVYTKTLNHSGGSISEAITLPALKAGTYSLQLSSDDNNFVKTFVVQ